MFSTEGFGIKVNDSPISPYVFSVQFLADEIEPTNLSYEDDGVVVEIIAGSRGFQQMTMTIRKHPRISETDYYGWFVLCNDRVVLVGDKSDATIWGSMNFLCAFSV